MKTTTLTPVAAVLFALVLFPACAKKKADEKKSEQPAIQTPKLVTPGMADTDYTTDCLGGAGSGSVELLRFTDKMMMREITDHSSNNCTSKTATTRIYHMYTLGAHRTDGVFDLDLVETEYALTAETDAIASRWRRDEKCGIRDWAVGQERTVRKGRDCTIDGDDRDRRAVYTVVKDEGNFLRTSFDTSNRDQDGQIPARRVTKLSELRYTRKAKNGTPAPGPIAGCPSLAAQYVCSTGHPAWENMSLVVANGIQNGQPAIMFVRTKNGQGQPGLIYQPGGAERVTEVGGERFAEREVCENNILRAFVTKSRSGDVRNRDIIETVIRVDDRQNLRISTLETRVTDDRPSRPSELTTVCEKR